MKNHVISMLEVINATGEDAVKLSVVAQHVDASVNGTFWDDHHVNSQDVFKEDKEAAQQLRVLINSEKTPGLNESALTESLTMLVQADRSLANRSIADALGASRYVSDAALLSNVNTLVDKAQDEYAKGESHVQDGDPVVAIEFYEKAWLYSEQAVSIVDSNTVPKVTITSPVSGSYTNVSSQIISGVVDDVALYTINNVSLSFNGETFDVPLANGVFNKHVSLAEGISIVKVTASDCYGNTGISEANVTLDTISPVINITGVEDGKYYNKDVLPKISIYDINIRSYYVLLNGTPYTGSAITDEGNYSLQVGADDLAGNPAYAIVNFTMDKTPPYLVVYEMTDNPTLRLPEYDLAGSTEADATLTINGIVIPHDGYFNYTANVTEGVNNFTVTATDLAGNIASWNKIRLVDTDMLPDYYEINATHTDPLKGDTDGNGIPDDQEDPDTDGLTNIQEYYLSTNPISADTDTDGLNDSFEVCKVGTSPCKADTNDDNVSDANSDPDHDGLTNRQEQQLDTDPLSDDTDTDGLNDGLEVNVYHTNPLVKDSDTDGLGDGAEVKLGTDPNSQDTNVNGIPDGNETYVQTFANETAGIVATICGVGDVGENLTLGNEDNPSVLLSNLSGVYKIASISVKNNVTWATVKMYYDPSNVTNTSMLRMFLYNTTTNKVELVEDQGVNTTGHYYWGNVSHFSDPFLADPSGWFNQWYVDWHKHLTLGVFKPGDRIKITSEVHNTGQARAENIQVEFRENDANGALIGTDTILLLNPGKTAFASIIWTATPGVEQIYVSVDPANLIVEVSNDNNDASGNIARYLDNDGDRLTDYEEINGMRTPFPYVPMKSDPTKEDTDTDGLDDGQEMGSIVYDAENKQLYDSLADQYGWNKSLYDGWHFEYYSDPSLPDTDGDGLNDKQECDAGLDRFHKDSPFIEEAIAGYILGDVGMDDPSHGNLAYLGGSIASSMTPLVEYVAMLRDIGADSWNGHWDQAGINIASIGLSVLFIEDVTPIEELPVVGAKVSKFVLKYQHLAGAVSKYLVNALPYDVAVKLLKENVYPGLSSSIRAGLGDEGMYVLSKLGLNLNNFKDCVIITWYKTVHGPAVVLDKYGIHVNVLYVAEKSRYLDNVAETISKLDYDEMVKFTKQSEHLPDDQAAKDWLRVNKGLTEDNMRQALRTKLTNTQNAEFGESITKYELLQREDLEVYGFDQGFYKTTGSTQQGLDFVCWDKTNKKFVIVEAKGTKNGDDIEKSILSDGTGVTQMSDQWILDAIQRMNKDGTISDTLSKQLTQAVYDKNFEKGLYVAQNVPYNENTIGLSIANSGLGVDNVNIVKLGDATT